MVHIQVSRGLDIPISGTPSRDLKTLTLAERVSSHPRVVGLDFSSFEEIKPKLLVHTGDRVKIGQPLIEDKDTPGLFFVSPAAGLIREIRRGLKRRLLDVIIEVDEEEASIQHRQVKLKDLSRESLVEYLKEGGLFTHIRRRPFNWLADPAKMPKSIFVKAVESAPFTPPAERQVEGFEEEFQLGLAALQKLTEGSVHLVYHHKSSFLPFLEAKGVEKHTVEGPHPIANPSLHIAKIDPILSAHDIIWTLSARDVVRIGYLLKEGRYLHSRVISLAGPALLPEKRGYFHVRDGAPIALLLEERLAPGASRYISGDPLTGQEVSLNGFLGYHHTVVCAIPEPQEREMLHFFRLGKEKYTFSGAYLSSHLKGEREFQFTTSLHGEHRPIMDGSLYDAVMPLDIPTAHLVKAILAEDLDLAYQLGLLEVDSEDFALPSFICPSKTEMVSIVKKGLQRFAVDLLK